MTTIPVRIRECRRSDLDAVMDIETRCFGVDGALPRIALTQYFDLCGPAFAVGESGSRVVAFAFGGTVTGGSRELGWLLDIAVLPEFQGQSVGPAICGYVVRTLFRFGVQSICATVSPDNERSLKMLTKIGFVRVAEVPDYFGLGRPRLILVCALSRNYRNGKH